MKAIKRFLSLAFVLVLCFNLLVPVTVAAEGPDDEVMPAWVDIVVIAGQIEPGLLGTYKATASAGSEHSGDKITLNCTLERFGSSGWASTGTTWSASSNGVVTATKSWLSLSVGDYRIKVEAVVYDKDDKYVETATSYVGYYTVT